MIQTARRGSFGGGGGQFEHRDLDGVLRHEYETLTCQHCSTVVLLRPDRERPRGRCTRCSRYLCDRCTTLHWQTGECANTQEMLDLALAFPGQGPFLARDPAGRPVFDRRLWDARRIW